MKPKICDWRSKTWSGICINTGNCKRQCINVEHATFGACHRQGFGFACFCYKNFCTMVADCVVRVGGWVDVRKTIVEGEKEGEKLADGVYVVVVWLW
ncbi:putative defensin, plant [Medicago truncatula]|uniref:Putative defensin, plant n=1 Tax=Medicago truncatula TaxID=3880 RepID=A0A396GBT5_MEDTR|nr:putative defensin, plant [Medicago truncatula]